MIVAIDIENYKINRKGEYEPVLDATGKYFTLGYVLKDTGGKKMFIDKEEMWKYIIELGKKELKRGKRLTVYSHNIRYDYYQIADLHDRNIRWFSEDPFICGYYFPCEKEFKNKNELERWSRITNTKGYEVIDTNTFGEIKIKYNKEGIKFLDSMSLFRMSLKRVGDLIVEKLQKDLIKLKNETKKE